MTNWILNGQKGSYDWNHNEEYRKCPYCGSDNHLGAFYPGYWEKVYRCGSIVRAEWGNEGYTVNYEGIKCNAKEGKYNNQKAKGCVSA